MEVFHRDYKDRQFTKVNGEWTDPKLTEWADAEVVEYTRISEKRREEIAAENRARNAPVYQQPDWYEQQKKINCSSLSFGSKSSDWWGC